MRMRESYVHGALLAILVVSFVPARGQEPAPAGRGAPAIGQAEGPARGAAPARGGRGGGRGAVVRSPEVSADGRVTFRLRAPNAKEVGVAFGGKARPMQHDEQGVWSLTTDPLKPDFYTYSLVVDGTSLNDPANRQVQTSWNSHQSMFVVPGPEPWFPKTGVARGAIARHRYVSSIAGGERDFFVYTPPGYDPRRSQRYPLMFLLHGLGDDAERWMNAGAAPVILDNLIAAGRAVPMVLVTTDGYHTNAGPNAASADTAPGYARILMTEVLPLVERSYHVSANREDRGIAGLSMGGAEAVYTALHNVNRFAWVGSFSGAFVMWPTPSTRGTGPGPAATAAPAGAAAPDAAPGGGRRGRGGRAPLTPAGLEALFPGVSPQLNSRLKLLWISCGTADDLLGVNRDFKDWLRSRKVAFYEEEAAGIGHVWPLWRQDFANFAERAFK